MVSKETVLRGRYISTFRDQELKMQEIEQMNTRLLEEGSEVTYFSTLAETPYLDYQGTIEQALNAGILPIQISVDLMRTGVVEAQNLMETIKQIETFKAELASQRLMQKHSSLRLLAEGTQVEKRGARI